MHIDSPWAGIGTLICDLDGVVYLGDEGIPGAGEALSRISNASIELLFVTNNSTKTPQQVAAKIVATIGYSADAASIITSAEVMAGQLAGSVTTALVVGGEAINVALEHVGVEVVDEWERAEAVVVGVDFALTYEKLAAASQAVRGGAAFHATNTDSTYPTPEGLLPGGGVMVGAVQIASGVAPVVSGKPEPAMIAHIAAKAKGAPMVVGDRPETDIAMAREAGWASVLVLTGVTSSLTEIPAEHTPDIVVESLPALAARLA